MRQNVNFFPLIYVSMTKVFFFINYGNQIETNRERKKITRILRISIENENLI